MDRCVFLSTRVTISSPAVCPQKTTSGQCCSIPFKYGGETYSSCTSADHYRPWCSLDPVYKGRWGNCPLPLTTTSSTVCLQKTTSGKCCSIPFKYKQVTFNSCTTADYNRTWCSLDPVYKGRWGICLVKPCLFSVNGSSGFISSSGTDYYYDYCTWIITAPANHTVKLKFSIFHLSNQAKIQVHDGKRRSDTVLGVFTGERQPFIIQTRGRFMVLTLQKDYFSTPCNFKGTFISSRKEKPRIRVPLKELRTVPEHYLWFLLEGTPPINLTLMNTSTPLKGGLVIKGFQLNRTGTYRYTLLAENEEGTHSKTVEVTVVDCKHLCHSTGSITRFGQVTNEHDCSRSNITNNWNCIPTTATKFLCGMKWDSVCRPTDDPS
ncbi:unnamed protein product [Porites lobata]|uniref:Uncharacterized protein n=1 Tax=Porites lobata TaxID=104759 RepID=A0ABN8RRB3_9CNID|nr:unnamed protein product [Porites lobata]